MLFAALFGGGILVGTWVGADDRSLHDVDMTEGELKKGDIIVAYGTWVYDAGHNDTNVGWNEFHPVKFMSKADHCGGKSEAAEWEHLITET